MEHKLTFGALGIGVVGWAILAALLASRRHSSGLGDAASPTEPGSTPVGARGSFLWLVFALPVLVWLSSLPVQPPFSSGQGWGRGFLLGGGIAALNIWVLGAFLRSNSSVKTAGALSLFGALVAASVPLLWMRSAVIEALLGAALGWIAVSLIRLLGSEAESATLTPEADRLATLVLNGAAYAATLLATAALGVTRDFVARDVARGTFPALALTLAASVALLFLIGALMEVSTAPLSNSASRLTLALAAVVPPGAAYLLATRVTEDLSAFYVVAIGMALGALLWLVVRGEMPQTEPPKRVSLPAILVALCAFMLSYQVMQGFGVGLMLLAAAPASLLSLPHASPAAEVASADSQRRDSEWQVAHTLSMVAAFGALTLLSRVFATRYHADLRGAGLDDQFSLFGFVAGATLPYLLTTLWFEARAQSEARSLWRIFPDSASGARLICLGVLAVLLPGATLLLWGIKIGPAFLLGLALCVVGEAGASRTQKSALALWAMGLSFGICQWSQRFLPLAEISRVQRLHWLLWGVGITLVFILLIDYGSRLLSGMRRNAAPTGVSL